MTRLLANNLFTIIFFTGFIGFLSPSQSYAKSAVAISANSQDYGFCYDMPDKATAEKCALHYCNEASDNCSATITCAISGFGAVFQNYTVEGGKGGTLSPKNSVTFAVCGRETTTEAREVASVGCKKSSKDKNPTLGQVYCYEKSFWYDTIDMKSKPVAKKPDDRWCDYASELSGIASFQDCLKSLRFSNPKKDCKQKVKIWCD